MRRRRWDTHDDPDPVSGLINLFDVWMVFAIAVLVVVVGASRGQLRDRATGQTAQAKASQDAVRNARPIDQYRMSHEELSGSGEKLGIAYRLHSGEIVCVPDSAPQSKDRSGEALP